MLLTTPSQSQLSQQPSLNKFNRKCIYLQSLISPINWLSWCPVDHGLVMDKFNTHHRPIRSFHLLSHSVPEIMNVTSTISFVISEKESFTRVVKIVEQNIRQIPMFCHPHKNVFKYRFQIDNNWIKQGWKCTLGISVEKKWAQNTFHKKMSLLDFEAWTKQTQYVNLLT